MKRIKAKCTDCEAECIIEFNAVIDPDDGETPFQPDMCAMDTGVVVSWEEYEN